MSKLMTGVTIDMSQSIGDRSGARRRRKMVGTKRRKSGQENEYEEELLEAPSHLIMTSPTVATRSGRIATMSWKGLTSTVQMKQVPSSSMSSVHAGGNRQDKQYDEEEDEEDDYDEEDQAAMAIEALVSFSQVKP